MLGESSNALSISQIVEMMDKQMLYYTSESVMLSQTESQEWVNSFDFHPLAFVQQVCIPKGTKCKRIEGNFRWDYTISFWHIMTDYLRNYVRVVSYLHPASHMLNLSYKSNLFFLI